MSNRNKNGIPASVVVTEQKVKEWNERISLGLETNQQQKSLDTKIKELDSLLRWSYQLFDKSLVQLTSFGASGMVVLHRLYVLRMVPAVRVITLDTLHLFPETYKFYDTVKTALHNPPIDLYIYQPRQYKDRIHFDEAYGKDFYKDNPDQYGYYTKVEPLQRAIRELQVSAMLTGRRQSQGGERTNLKWVDSFLLQDDENENDTGYLIAKINPLLEWSYEEVWQYIHRYRVPYNPLYDRGYKSIGDVMTTNKVSEGDPERSGRFVGLSNHRTECGLHSHLKRIKELKEKHQNAENGADEEFHPPTIECPACSHVEVTTDNFESVVLYNNRKDVLIEFYSPYCGACADWGPHFATLAQRLHQYYASELDVMRFDVTQQQLPPVLQNKFGIEITSTPHMILVAKALSQSERQKNEGAVKEEDVVALDYTGSHEGQQDIPAIFSWLESNTEYVRVADMEFKH